jgi:hypothetical protein
MAMTRIAILLAAGAVALGACAANNGMTQTRPDARPFADANAECWEVSMNIAGFGATSPQARAYESCMARNGWADRRSM